MQIRYGEQTGGHRTGLTGGVGRLRCWKGNKAVVDVVVVVVVVVVMCGSTVT